MVEKSKGMPGARCSMMLHVLQQQIDLSPAGGGPHALTRRPVVQRRQRLVKPGGVVARLELRYQLLLFG